MASCRERSHVVGRLQGSVNTSLDQDGSHIRKLNPTLNPLQKLRITVETIIFTSLPYAVKVIHPAVAALGIGFLGVV